MEKHLAPPGMYKTLYFCRISEPSAVWPSFTFNQSYRAPAGYIPGWSDFKGLNRPMVTKGALCRADGYPHVTPLITGDFGPTGCRHLNTQTYHIHIYQPLVTRCQWGEFSPYS